MAEETNTPQETFIPLNELNASQLQLVLTAMREADIDSQRIKEAMRFILDNE